jgi:hypothetical protein
VPSGNRKVIGEVAHDRTLPVVNEQRDVDALVRVERLHREWKRSGACFVSNFISLKSLRAPARLIFTIM